MPIQMLQSANPSLTLRLNSSQTVSMDKQCSMFDEDAKLLVYYTFKCVMILNFTGHMTLNVGPLP